MRVLSSRGIAIIQHACLLFLVGYYFNIALQLADYLYDEDGPDIYAAFERYGVFATAVLYALSITLYFAIPIAVCNLLGILLYNPFKQGRVTSIPKDLPFICFRVVTRGLYPNLVQTVTNKNLEVCLKTGLHSFVFQIVTDQSVNIQHSHHIRELVVPPDYKTPKGTLFKARALNYCLLPTMNILSPKDWIVHLDEETQLTDEVIHGIVGFISKDDARVGQGVIAYGGLEIVNWLTTLMDGVRTAVDYGLFRFGLERLHRPLFGLKGSFIVVEARVEEDVTFDFGPKESIAEDLRFALTAWGKGYRFDFVHGQMLEKSTFTICDMIKQRKRWFIGHFYVIWSNTLPLPLKIFVLPMHVANLLLWTNIVDTILSFIAPKPITKIQLQMFLMLCGYTVFMILFGNFMSLKHRKLSVLNKIVICALSQLLLPVIGVTEAVAALLGFFANNKIAFDIVQKEIDESHTATHEFV